MLEGGVIVAFSDWARKNPGPGYWTGQGPFKIFLGLQPHVSKRTLLVGLKWLKGKIFLGPIY